MMAPLIGMLIAAMASLLRCVCSSKLLNEVMPDGFEFVQPLVLTDDAASAEAPVVGTPLLG